MRHRVVNKRFTRDANARKMLMRGLVRSYVEHGQIVTTLEKAKETRRIADKLINKARTNSVAVRRQLHAFFGERAVANTLIEKIAPAMGKRVSGFSTIARLGKRRGDNTEMARLSLIEQPKNLHTLKSGTMHTKKKATRKAKKTTAKPSAKKAATPRVLAARQRTEAKPKSTKVTQRVTRKLAQKGQ